MKEAIYKSYFKKKGKKVVDMNNASIDHGINELVAVEIPEAWAAAEDAPKQDNVPEFIKEIVAPMNRQQGDALTVGQMMKYGLEDGTWPAGTSQYEKRGMGLYQEAEKDAVQSGYCQLYRYNPGLAEHGKNPFQLDYSKEPNGEFQTLIKGQNRYASLKLSFPEKADGLYEKAEADAKHRFETYKELADD